MISVEDFWQSASRTINSEKKPAFKGKKRAKEYRRKDL
jgi:hypothetical protein